MVGGVKAKGGKKGRKIGGKKEGCKRYEAEGRREKNKKRGLRRHMKKYPNDMTAQTALDLL